MPRTSPLVAMLLVLLLPRLALAHAIGVDCTVRGDTIEVEAFYDDDTPARNARVRVLDTAQNAIASGRTDAKGLWSFPRPAPGQYKVEVNAGGGHHVDQTITVPAPEHKVEPEVTVIRTGVRREEFTRFPWLGVGTGLVLIGAVGGAVWLAGVLRKNGQKAS